MCSNEGGVQSRIWNTFTLPTRLIDIGPNTPLRPRHRDSIEIDPKSKYLTLSHCWGKSIPKRLLQSNLLAMKQSIVLEELSQTFQDTLAVTGRLGLRYIWLDSLCIIQDSEEDRLRESAQMSHIYSNSYCNLAATAAKDGSGVLFYQRDIRTIQPLCIRIGGTGRKIVDVNMWERGVEDAPLNQELGSAKNDFWHLEIFISPQHRSFGSVTNRPLANDTWLDFPCVSWRVLVTG
jgi:hypothetical protein